MARSSQSDDLRDVSKQAQTALDYIIAGKEEEQAIHNRRQMPVSQALTSDQVVRFSSERTRSRVLFITSDKNALKDSSWVQAHLQNVSDMFEELHLAVLTRGKKREYRTQRIGQNIWVYNVDFYITLFLSQVMERFAESQLQFGEGFRPDVIVALDPYYAGQAALSLAKRYDRPVQIHVLEDFLAPEFVENNKENKKKVSAARKVLKKAESVRTNSSLMKDKLEKEFPKIGDVGILPRHFDTDALVKAKRKNTLKQKYPQYVFTVLTAGLLDQDSTMYRTLDAARDMLHSPKIGLVIVGDGPMRGELEQRANILGIKEQVVFERDQRLLNDYMLSADMFVCTDTTAIGDEYVIQAAAAGLPMVIARTPLREDLFEDGRSALLCDPESTTEFSQKMKSILNTNAFRQQFSTMARSVIKDRLHTDPELYRQAYRDSIEVVFGNVNVPPPRDEADVAADVAAAEAAQAAGADAPAAADSAENTATQASDTKTETSSAETDAGSNELGQAAPAKA